MNSSTRAIVRTLAIITAFVAVLYFAFLTRTILVWMLSAFALSLALNPAVAWIAKHMPGKSRLLATLITFIVLAAALAGLGILLLPPLVDQTAQLIHNVPRYTQEIIKPGTFTGNIINQYHLVQRIQESQSSLVNRLTSASGTFFSVVTGIASSVIASLTIIGLTFFMLLEGPNWLRLFWASHSNIDRRERNQRLAGEMYRATIGYVLGKLVAALLAGGAAAIMLVILGVPFAVPLGLVVGLFSILPLVGATIAAAIVVIVTVFTSTTDAIIMAIFFLIYQQVENNVIQPLIFNKTVSVSPLLVFVSVLMGTAVGGIIGALIAIPVIASVQILVKDLYISRMGHMPEIDVADGKPAQSKQKVKA